MARSPEYLQRLIESLPEFEGLQQDWIDRKTVQEIVGVSKTVAWRILRRLGSVGPGGALMCSKLQIINGIRQLQVTGDWAFESGRRARVESNLEQLAGAARARGVVIARGAKSVELLSTTPDRLPDGICFRPYLLVVNFSSAVDLFQKLFALVSACKNEPDEMIEYIDGLAK
jgi:hypothetical protein